MRRTDPSLGLLLLSLACNRPVTPGAGATSAAHDDPNAGPTASGSAAAAAAVRVPPALPDGCFAGIDNGLDSRKKLLALADRCATAMEPLWPEPFVAELAPNARRELPFTIEDTTRCLRVIAAGDPGVEELELQVLGPGAGSLGQDDLPGAFALVQHEGPVCPSESGRHRAVVRLASGRGHVAVQVYQAVDAQRRTSVHSTAPSRSTRATTSP